MASRVLQRCVRNIHSTGIIHVQVATKMSNPLKKAKKKAETTFIETEADNIIFRGQQKKRSPEEDAVYRKAEIVANMVNSYTIFIITFKIPIFIIDVVSLY